MKTSTRLPLIVFALVLILWGYSLFFIPTFDLDESLYRRVAQEMKVTHLWWSPVWDELPLNHKPPFLYWIIAGMSRLIDGPGDTVSIFASRLPSFLASLGVLWALYLETRTLTASLLWLCALLPVVTATAVIFDPIQTLLLLPALFIPSRLFSEQRKPTLSECIFWVLSLFTSTAWKGLNGILIPTFAYGLHLLVQTVAKKISIQTLFKEVLIFTVKIFIPASFLSFAIYAFLDQKMGRAFTSEFFLVHHLGRGTQAMEDHNGSLLYHPLTLFLGGTFLIPFLLLQWQRVKNNFTEWGYPLTYTFAFVFVFSLSATKLPHYTLPVWPALALWGSQLFTADLDETYTRPSKTYSFFASFPILFLGTLLLFLACTPFDLVNSFHWAEPTHIALQHLSGIDLLERISFGIGAFLCFIFQGRRSEITLYPALTAFFSVATSLCFALGVTPLAKEMLVTPFHDIAQDVKALHPQPTDCIRFTGAHSPTLSLELGFGLWHNRCPTETAKYFIAPQWKLAECQERGLKIVSQHSYLFLCVK